MGKVGNQDFKSIQEEAEMVIPFDSDSLMQNSKSCEEASNKESNLDMYNTKCEPVAMKVESKCACNKSCECYVDKGSGKCTFCYKDSTSLKSTPEERLEAIKPKEVINRKQESTHIANFGADYYKKVTEIKDKNGRVIKSITEVGYADMYRDELNHILFCNRSYSFVGKMKEMLYDQVAIEGKIINGCGSQGFFYDEVADLERLIHCGENNTSDTQPIAIYDTIFKGVIFNKVDFTEISVFDCKFESCIFYDCKLDNTYFRNTTMNSCDFFMAEDTEEKSAGLLFIGCDIYDVYFREIKHDGDIKEEDLEDVRNTDKGKEETKRKHSLAEFYRCKINKILRYGNIDPDICSTSRNNIKS